MSCPRKIFQASLTCADDGAKLTHRVTRWILLRLAIDRLSVSATAKALGVGWELVNQVALDACRQLVYDDSHHLDGVRILGVDEHVWKHTRRPTEPSNLVTILVDLTPLIDGRGPARLLDIRPDEARRCCVRGCRNATPSSGRRPVAHQDQRTLNREEPRNP